MEKTAAAKRLPLVGIALGAVFGIWIADKIVLNPVVLFAVLGVCLLLMLRGSGWFFAFLATAGAFAIAHTWQWQENPHRLWAEAHASQTASATGIFLEEPIATGNGWRALMQTESWTTAGRSIPLSQPIMVRWKTQEVPKYGDRWTIEGFAELPKSPRNPGAFDSANWLARRGVYLELRSKSEKDAWRISEDEGSWIKEAAITTRHWIMHTIESGLEHDEEARGVIAGITLGARESVMEEFAPAFRQTGTMHLFAVSGLHVGMFALLIWLVLRSLGFSRKQSTIFIIPLLFFYSLVTGAQPSSLRAATMISIALGGFLLDRPATSGNSLAAAALILLGMDSNQLFQPGFQLSFCVVASIILLAPPLDLWLAARLRPDPFLPRKLYTSWQNKQATVGRFLAGALAVSCASWLGSLPLTIGYFHILPAVAIPVNIIAIPLAFAVLSVSMLSIASGVFSIWLASVFNQTNWALASLLLGFVQWSSTLPGAWFQMPPSWTQPPARLTVFDLSTGGAQFLRTREQAWLLDSGTAYDFDSIIEPALRAAGVARLDGLILTHGDNEHIGGVMSAIAATQPRRILDSALRDRSRIRKNIHEQLAERKFPKGLVFAGDRVSLGNDTALVFLTPSTKQKASIADDQAIVVRIDSNGFRVLLMSDSGINTEDYLLRKHRGEVRADILVLCRHGKDVFATSEFLSAVKPTIIILAPPDPFRDGSSEPALRARLKASGATIFDQAECGAVITTFRDRQAEVAGFLGGQKRTLHSAK